MSTERIHHVYSPSSLQTRESCPKFASNFTGSEAARMGTLQHDAAERGEDNAELPDDKAAAVASCIQFVEERVALMPGCKVLREIEVRIDDEEIIIEREGAPHGTCGRTVFKGTTSGFLDVALISQDQKEAEVIDFKYGQHGVEAAESNLQSAAYLLGLVRIYPTIERARVWFVLPHRDEILGATFTKDQFDGMRLRIRTVVHRAIEANRVANDFSMASPNQSACLFCSLVGKCPAVAAVALKVGHKYAPLSIPESISTAVFEDPTQVALGLKLAAIIKVWADAYRAQATAKTVEDPNFVPAGYKLVSMAKRKVVHAKKLGDLAKESLPPEDHEKVEALYDLPIGKVEKLISIAAPRGSKESSVADFGLAALAIGAVEEGQPYAFLRQDTKAPL